MTELSTIAPEHLEHLVGAAGCHHPRYAALPPAYYGYGYGYGAPPFRAAYAPAWWQAAPRRPWGARWW